MSLSEVRCNVCEGPLGISPTALGKPGIFVCFGCAQMSLVIQSTDQDRQSELAAKLKKIVDSVFEHSSRWKLTTDQFRESAPLWPEFRDSLMRVIFEIECEQKEQELNAIYTAENCI